MALRVVLVALLLSVAAHAEQVVRVKDGDSLVVDSAGRQVDVRLADIDAPEHRQPCGDEASALLRSLVEGREVQLQLVGGDAYRRVVAHVFVDGVDVNAELVRRGLAWVRRGYDPAPQLIRHEDEARDAQRGLWADADATPPWGVASCATCQQHGAAPGGTNHIANRVGSTARIAQQHGATLGGTNHAHGIGPDEHRASNCAARALWHQARMPRNDLLRRSARLHAAMRRHKHGRRWRRRAL